MQLYPKRLIEVDLPIKRISAHARREKSIRHGHISTLHIWWARRPLAACRAVICASLWPDPADPNCPQSFRDAAAKIIQEFAKATQSNRWGAEICDNGSFSRYMRLAHNGGIDPSNSKGQVKLRAFLLDFIADFAAWEASTNHWFLDTARSLTREAHMATGGIPGTAPLVIDPFAGGGTIPLEALRVGAEAFASDINPVAILLNKVSLEYIPKYGERLATELRKWGHKLREVAQRELRPYYPHDEDGGTPIVYFWARTVVCEGPGCGAQIPLTKNPVLRRNDSETVAVAFDDDGPKKLLNWELVSGKKATSAVPTSSGMKAICPRPDCQYSTPKKQVQAQLTEQKGGADSATLLAVLVEGPQGRTYRLANDEDLAAITKARRLVQNGGLKGCHPRLSPIPDEPIPTKTAHRAVGSQLPLYGFKSWGDLFMARQKVALLAFQRALAVVREELNGALSPDEATAIFSLLAIGIDKQADFLSSLCRWVSGGEFVAATLGGEKKLPMLPDFAEVNPCGSGSGNWNNQIDWIARYIEREATTRSRSGTVVKHSADQHSLPADVASAFITDPPYYDSVPYSDLSDFYYVWLRRSLGEEWEDGKDELTPKDQEATVNHPRDKDQILRYERLLTGAFKSAREVTVPNGLGVIVFAHKSTSGWEALLEAIIRAGWVVTASWPIDTERANRMNALDTASLNSSVHIVCRPRENADGSLQDAAIGDWRDVLTELPKRIQAWMSRLAREGVVGADAIFACLGPALEIFSRYSVVEKASGEPVSLKDYLNYVWGAVAQEALTQIFSEADASGFEEDARLTAMWLWTLNGGATVQKSAEDSEDTTTAEVSDDDEEEEGSSGNGKATGYVLEFDAARKIAQGLGAHLEDLSGVVEVKGDKARLLGVPERTRQLFGNDEAEAPQSKRKKKDKQMKLFSLEEVESERDGWGDKSVPKLGDTTLDRVHQSMILFAAGRGEALRRFLTEDGAGRDQRFWKLANALSALYPKGTDEKRWVDGVLARKKGLGL